MHDDATLSRAIQAAMISETDPTQLLEWARQADELATRTGDMWGTAYATTSYMRALVDLGRLEELRPILDRHAEVCSRVFLLTGFFEEWCYRLILALARGDFESAEAAADRCLEIGADHPSGPGMYGLQMFAIRREQGRLAEAAPVLELAAKSPDGALWLPGLAALYTELGLLDKARDTVNRLAPGGFAVVPRDSLWTATGMFLADACIALEDRANAVPLYEDLKGFTDRNLMVAMTVCFGPADRVLGGLASVLGRDDDAEAHFASGVAVAERSRAPVWLARVQYEWARHKARAGDTAGAADLADRALEVAERFGMVRFAEQCREIPRRPVLSAVPTVGHPDGLSEREVEVLRCIATGCSNREIGERLNISGNTAANHVRAILQKTGCANRAEAAAYAARMSLLRD
jgi:DNA-binding CsgD family transcriptional regulator